MEKGRGFTWAWRTQWTIGATVDASSISIVVRASMQGTGGVVSSS